MDSKYKVLALGIAIGGVASLVLAMPSIVPRSMADEQPVKSLYAAKDAVTELFDGGRKLDLVKPQWDIEPSVSTEVTSSQVIRKIEMGRTTFVTIATTATGTYSSDGMDSVHFRYPGIHRVGVSGGGTGMLAELGPEGWKVLHEVDAGSFVSVTPFKGGQMVIEGDGACVFLKNAVYC